MLHDLCGIITLQVVQIQHCLKPECKSELTDLEGELVSHMGKC